MIGLPFFVVVREPTIPSGSRLSGFLYCNCLPLLILRKTGIRSPVRPGSRLSIFAIEAKVLPRTTKDQVKLTNCQWKEAAPNSKSPSKVQR